MFARYYIDNRTNEQENDLGAAPDPRSHREDVYSGPLQKDLFVIQQKIRRRVGLYPVTREILVIFSGRVYPENSLTFVFDRLTDLEVMFFSEKVQLGNIYIDFLSARVT